MNALLDSHPVTHCIAAEQSVLGALMQNHHAVDHLGELKAAHFYRTDHRLIFEEIRRQAQAGQAFDMITVWEALNARHQAQAVGGLSYLHALVQNTPGSANIAHYAEIVRDKALRRDLIKLAMQMEEQAKSSPLATCVLVEEASSNFERLSQQRVKQVAVKACDDLTQHIALLEGRLNGSIQAVSTGFAELDALLAGGIRGGDLIVLAARPKMGKTALALNIGLHVAVAHPVLVLSLEMPTSQLQDRNLAVLGHIPLSHLMQPHKMTPENWNGVPVAAMKLSQMALYFDDEGGLGLAEVRTKARLQKRKYGLTLLIIDYLQLMDGEGENRNAQIERITRGLKALAKELNCGILLVSQLNREVEKRQNKRPQSSDLRDSGAIEQDADAVIFLYREEMYNQDTPDAGVCEVEVALCRQGEPGRVYLRYIGAQTRFMPMAAQWEPRPRYEIRQFARRGIAKEL